MKRVTCGRVEERQGRAGLLSVERNCGEDPRFDEAPVADTGDELIEGIAVTVDRAR